MKKITAPAANLFTTAFLILSLALFLSACAAQDNNQQNTGNFVIEIEAADQKPIDNKVIIDKASIPVDGWLVIHEYTEKKGKNLMDTQLTPEKILGFKYLPRGPNKNIEVEIKPTSQKKLMAAIYVDKGRKGLLDVPGEDHPYTINMGTLFTIFSLQP